MASVATVKYGTYTFSPVPQIGIRASNARLGEMKFGPATQECVITLSGYLFGATHAEVATAVMALRVAMAQGGKAFYWHDGTTEQINLACQPIAGDIPEDWWQYEARYTITIQYYPGDEWNSAHGQAVSYNGYSFDPIPILGRDYSPQRDNARDTRRGSAMQITLQGFIQKGSWAANYTSWNLLQTACATDGTLTYGVFVQAVRVVKLSQPADIGDIRLSFSLVLEYDLDLGAGGIIKMESHRTVISEERDAVDHVPFFDDGQVQIVGRSAQRITASGYIIADTMAHAQAAAYTEIEAQFPGTYTKDETTTDCVEPTRQIEESSTSSSESSKKEFKVSWNVERIYPTPLLVGGVYGALAAM